MYKRVLVPIDGSQQAVRALDSALALANSHSFSSEIQLTVLHVNPSVMVNEPPIGVDLNESIEVEGQHILEQVLKKLNDSKINFDSIIKTGDPASVICHTADNDHYDLIVMGSRGVGLISEILLGSVSHSVIQHAHCPVLIIK